LASGPKEICDLFAEFIQRTYTDDFWVSFDPDPEHVPFGALQFTSDKVENVLLDLDVNKGSGPDSIPPIILKNCASQNHYLSFLTALWQRAFSPTGGKVSYVNPIFKKGRRNNVEDYRGVAILSAIPKRFELLVYLMSINQHGFMKNQSTITNVLEYATLVLSVIPLGITLLHLVFQQTIGDFQLRPCSLLR
jgi:hypothetical protein